MEFYIGGDFQDASDLEKARAHKYVKRTGGPGHYVYWYKQPNGSIAPGDSKQQESGRIDHAKRMLAGIQDGLHTHDHAHIARETGHSAAKVRSLSWHMNKATEDGKHHGYAAHHMEESTADTGHHSYAEHAARGEAEAHGAAVPATPSPNPGEQAEREAAATRVAAKRAKRVAAAARPVSDHGATEHVAATVSSVPVDPNAEKIRKLREKLKNDHGIDLGTAPLSRDTTTNSLLDSGTRAASAMDAEAASARAISAASAPSSPASVAVSAVDPDFGRSEAALTRAVADQAAGENPYLKRATDIFNKIKGDLKPDRKQAVEHFLQAHSSVVTSGVTPTKENLKAAYLAIPGNQRKFVLPVDEIERGMFHTLDEMLNNPPIDPEVERMKRGYAAKQFARLKPYLKDSWHAANPAQENGTPPPPMPTFGDIKKWRDLPGGKPAWAGTTELAMPKEVFDAAVKIDGKPQYPKPWMPIHLMPVWNYIVKSEGEAAYTQKTPSAQQVSSMNFGNQAVYQEGKVIGALRKYVQMRGGADKLVDIPTSKLTEHGTTHADIFKSKNLSDDQIKKIVTMKIIDPVALVAILMDEKKEVKKSSISLVVSADEVYMPSISKSLTKSDPIIRIKEILRARGRD